MSLPPEDEIAELRGQTGAVPLVRTVPSDVLTPVSAFLRLSTWAVQPFLLESVEGGELVGRYSFLGAGPTQRVGLRGGEVVQASAQEPRCGTAEDDGDALARIQRCVAPRPTLFPAGRREHLGSELPPFTGGWVGYAAWDLVRLLEPIGAGQPPDAGEWQLLLSEYRTVLAFDHLRHSVQLITTLVLEGDESAASIRVAYRMARAHLERIEQELRRPHWEELAPAGSRLPSERGGTEVTGGMEQAAFVEMVALAREQIARGEIFQVVLSQCFQRLTGAHPFAVYRARRMINPSPYLFYLDLGEQILLGASPEMLVQVKNRRVQTRPIAGTRPRGASRQEDDGLAAELLADPKERAEHVMLVDLGRNDIGRVAAPGTVSVPQFMEIERFSHVMHIVSAVEGELAADRAPLEAFLACFPAGTVSGAPKVRAMQIIDELEPGRRGPYAGAILYLDHRGNLDSCITIRTVHATRAQVDGESPMWRLRFQAGAGIVWDSVPAREYEETVHKSNAIRVAIAMAENGFRRPDARVGGGE
ncbi:MAG: chorismate-binding protein [Candidatus Schekmanbacteria bacterium]|nr:chorismate-binding protein [Candidatus Schekmanbacteria bacterium]